MSDSIKTLKLMISGMSTALIWKRNAYYQRVTEDVCGDILDDKLDYHGAKHDKINRQKDGHNIKGDIKRAVHGLQRKEYAK